MRLFIVVKLLLAVIFILNVFNQFSEDIFAKVGKYSGLKKCFSVKNMWHSSQVFRGIVAPIFQINKSILKCDMMWLFDRNLLSKLFSLSYIIRTSDIQAKTLKEIDNNYSEL